MLRQRIFTTAMLAPLFLAAVGYLPNPFLAGLFGLIILIGAWELSRLVQLNQQPQQSLYLISLAVAMLVMYHISQPAIIFSLQIITTLCWASITLWALYRRRPLTKVSNRRPRILISGTFALLITWISLVQLHQTAGVIWLFGLFILIWSVDIGAYFTGRQWGKRRISPQISPGKTWAGAFGAMAAATLYAIGFSLWQAVPLVYMILFSYVVTWLSIGGDLAESVLKRQASVKDSSNLLPGHGGILDRIDSLLAAAPAYTLGISLLGLTT